MPDTHTEGPLPAWVVQASAPDLDMNGDTIEVWHVTATFERYADAEAFAKNRASRERRLRVGSVHVAYDEARP